MNVLYSTHTSPDYMPPLAISEQQIIVGPSYPFRMEGKTVRTLNVSPGRYNLATLVASLPVEQKPDVTIVLVGAYQTCLPEGLADVPGQKILLVADTHHGNSPLQKMLAYARQEGFDRIVVTHDPHHLHWFREADVAPSAYIPNINCAYFPLRLVEQRRPAIIFVGQVGEWHPRRHYLLEQIQRAGLPLIVTQAPAPVAATLYNSTQITFNCSLNGDLNMRIFEVLAAGGFLVTDRLSQQSGLDMLFRSGKEYVEYNELDDLLELLRHYLAHPDECLKIAKAGHEAYLARHSPEQRVCDVLDFIFGKSLVEYCNDPRAALGGHGFGRNLDERIRVYELLQSLSLQKERVIVHADVALEARAISDLVDLPRLRILINGTADINFRERLRHLGVSNQLEFLDDRTARCDIQVIHTRNLRDALNQNAQLVAVMTDGTAIDGQAQWFESRGFDMIGEVPWLFKRVD